MDVTDIYNLFGIEANPTESVSFDDAFGLGTATAASGSQPLGPESYDTALGSFRADKADACTSTPTQSAAATPAPKPRKKRYAPRTRDGCLTCRARRKKCDAAKPVCRTCVRVNAECQWPQKLHFSDRNRQLGSVDGKRVALVRPLTNASPDTRSNDIDSGGSTIRAHLTETETAPNPCVPRSLAPKPRYGRELDPSQAALERHLLSYYISVVIPRMTIVPSNGNFFTSLYIPMAFQHTAVFDVTIACSAAHLAKSTSDPRMAWQLRHVAAQRQSLAHQFIQKPLYNPDSSGWTSSQLEIITVLLFSIGLGAQGGDRSLRWMQRVNCVRELLKQHETSAAAAWTTWETACIRAHFRYYDWMSLIMEDALDTSTRDDLRVQSGSFAHCSLTRSQPQAQTCIRPELDIDQQLLPSLEYQTASPRINCLLGLSEDLFDIITRLRDLPDAGCGNIWERDFLQLQQELSNWRYDDEQALALDPFTRLDLISLAECYRLTSMILLFRRWPSQHFYLPALASQVMSIVQRISPSSTVATALPPILFLAGAEVRSPDEMELCAARLTEASKAANSDITPAEEVLQAVWRERLRNDARTDWLDILRARKWTFSLA